MTFTTSTTKLAGQQLLDFIHSNQSMAKADLCQSAGYASIVDGVTKYQFTDFYVAILDAKKANGEYQEPSQSDGDWYDSLSEQDKDLYDTIEDMCPEFSKLDAEQCQEFMDELSENGVTTAQEFNDAYFSTHSGWKAEADFAKYIITELNCFDVPDYVVIDWQATWDSALCCDFFTIEFDGETYFFSNNF